MAKKLASWREHFFSDPQTQIQTKTNRIPSAEWGGVGGADLPFRAETNELDGHKTVYKLVRHEGKSHHLAAEITLKNTNLVSLIFARTGSSTNTGKKDHH